MTGRRGRRGLPEAAAAAALAAWLAWPGSTAPLPAQTAPSVPAGGRGAAAAADAAGAGQAAVLVPPTVYVGDRARLIVTIADQAGAYAAAVDNPDRLPKAADLVVHRLELVPGAGSCRVYIDFTPYAPGELRLPESAVGGAAVPAQIVVVASVLAQDAAAVEASPPAPSLQAPGTVWLFYGAAAAAAALAGLALWYWRKGRGGFRRWRERRRRLLAARSMRRVLARLAADDDPSARTPERIAADFGILSRELRSYLSYRLAFNCLALTAGETVGALAGLDGAVRPSAADAAFLAELLGRDAAVRFGGLAAERSELLVLAERTGGLVDRIEAAGA